MHALTVTLLKCMRMHAIIYTQNNMQGDTLTGEGVMLMVGILAGEAAGVHAGKTQGIGADEEEP